MLRYWDGSQWTAHTSPVRAAPPPSSPPNPTASGRHAQPDSDSKVPLFGARKLAEELQEQNQELQRENEELRAALARVHAMELVDVEAEVKRQEAEVQRLRAEKASLESEIEQARSDLVETQGLVQLQDVGLYDYHHPAESSVALREQLDAVRGRIKQFANPKSAIMANHNFTFNNSAAQGRRFVDQMSRIMLRAYNAEVENCVKTVKAGNLPAAQARLAKAVQQIEKQGTMIDLRITPAYHEFRLLELQLAADYQMQLKREKEAEKERIAREREDRLAQQELERERERLEKEHAHYSNVLEKLQVKGDEEGAQRMQEKLADVQRAIEDVDYRAANKRAGYVYVISNIGSFGRHMVKIGLTRRLEPMDRVRELGDASVPFRYDVHALFFADDAVTVEHKLHEALEAKRVNRINARREFFYASPDEVLPLLKSTVGELVEYTVTPEAEEYRLSLGTPDTTL
ncbi:small-conductance mechanosensitive channel [Mycobacterium sp. JS623]|nr:small-conductance mechanosensitive channel [Mycobacterium sp. JS623]